MRKPLKDNCHMRTRLVGDGCEACNPKKALQYAKENITELEMEIVGLESALRDAFEFFYHCSSELPGFYVEEFFEKHPHHRATIESVLEKE